MTVRDGIEKAAARGGRGHCGAGSVQPVAAARVSAVRATAALSVPPPTTTITAVPAAGPRVGFDAAGHHISWQDSRWVNDGRTKEMR